jgi:hypothetical protein
MPSALARRSTCARTPIRSSLEIGEHRSVSIPFSRYQCNSVNSNRHPLSLNGRRWWPLAALCIDSVGMLSRAIRRLVVCQLYFPCVTVWLVPLFARQYIHPGEAANVSCDRGDDRFAVSN